ncbi:MAG TPA: ATP-binding protein [Chitinophagaceae bacterium]|nr:tetratricopeptide repeat protein [Chitinophagaceae bacterium]MBP7107059.1 tetratricopeptide repeat protein [Chitinophagaceae bacterium]MBP7315224.1 tetratricopeptide repeat protein [Chitinophagaceae bacterium]HQV56020.1 ATP-binding protein [Chitinophagaceae bacterium]HQX97831.1 ATP-binding protein [Chitinophagaceae bacterium]
MRNKFFLFFFFLTIGFTAHSQENIPEQIELRCDSILNLLIKEKDENKKADLITSFYGTAIDGFPLQLLSLSQKLLDASKKYNDIFSESAALSAAGQAYRLTGNYVKALELHRQAVTAAEKTSNKILIGFALNQMGHIYKDRLENEKALTLYRDAFRNFETAGRNDIWYACMNIGVVFYNMGNYDSSLFYSNEAQRRIDNTPGVGNQSGIYSNIASVYSQKNLLDSVQKYFWLSLKLATSTQSPRYLNITYVAIAEHFNRIKQYDSSAFYFKKAVNVVSGTEMNNLVLKPAKLLTEYYQNINPDSTVKYWKVYSAANDSVNSLRTNQQIQMLTFEEEQRKRNIEASQVAYQNKIRTGILLGGLAVLSIVGFILYRNSRQKQKANKVLETTLTNLKSTQSQLVQSEKMASLGELTAGIAHEIQNPLNFVNNFSEVNTELAEELEQEIDKGNYTDAKAIAKDIKENELKINHHGKRADAIVKGMLQHSRSSSGVKEPTDINALCDEYLRLSYHGLRAKDKSFNATIKTDFDNSIGNINIIPQDIGRVILNLLTNAFYVVDEKKKSGIDDYEPIVSIETKATKNPLSGGRGAEIRVTDNGNGISQKVLEKIFQPFFTTKPTGQGTGLGLSLSYDIVKAHGGELKVETKEARPDDPIGRGEGTTLIITLPA